MLSGYCELRKTFNPSLICLLAVIGYNGYSVHINVHNEMSQWNYDLCDYELLPLVIQSSSSCSILYLAVLDRGQSLSKKLNKLI